MSKAACAVSMNKTRCHLVCLFVRQKQSLAASRAVLWWAVTQDGSYAFLNAVRVRDCSHALRALVKLLSQHHVSYCPIVTHGIRAVAWHSR